MPPVAVSPPAGLLLVVPLGFFGVALAAPLAWIGALIPVAICWFGWRRAMFGLADGADVPLRAGRLRVARAS